MADAPPQLLLEERDESQNKPQHSSSGGFGSGSGASEVGGHDDDDVSSSSTSTLPPPPNDPVMMRRQGDGAWPYPLLCFRDFWLTERLAESIKLVQAQFKPRPDDILLVTFPKCGTTWLKALAFAVINRSRHPVNDDDDHPHPLLGNNPHDLVPYLEMPSRRLYPVAELEALPSPRLLCTHAPPELLPAGTLQTTRAVVYLCREPKDAFVSLWHHMQAVRRNEQGFFADDDDGGLDEAFRLFCDGVSICGPVWEHYLEYWKRSVEEPGRVLFFRYEEMMAQPADHVKALAGFLGVPFTEEEESRGVVEQVVRLCSFQNLKELSVNTHGVRDRISAGPNNNPISNSLWFRSGKVGGWENHLTQDMAHKLDCIIQEKLKGSGLTF